MTRDSNPEGTAGEGPERTYTLDDLEQDYEGLYVECPGCNNGFYLGEAGECPICGLGYELEVRFETNV